jgi:hypothetical protein
VLTRAVIAAPAGVSAPGTNTRAPRSAGARLDRIAVTRREQETGRRDADDHVRFAVNRRASTDDVRSRVESFVPASIAQDHDGAVARRSLSA